MPAGPALPFLQRAVDIAVEGVRAGRGGPFGAVVVRSGSIVGEGANEVTSTNDPTAHAEIVAIRAACRRLGTHDLTGCEVYASCEPCPMCLAAILWARIGRVYHAGTRADAAGAGFDDAAFYEEIAKPLAWRKLPVVHVALEGGLAPFEIWARKADRREY